MDPITAAGSFATIVGLMADFASSRGQKDDLEIKDFTEWLVSHGHTELKELIESNKATTLSIKASLAEGKQEFLARLSRIEGLLISLTAGEGSLAELAASLRPDSILSRQATDLLVAFETTQAGKALEIYTSDGLSLHFLDGKNGSFAPKEPRFFKADLDSLINMGLLSVSKNSSNRTVFHITRQGAEVAAKIIQCAESE